MHEVAKKSPLNKKIKFIISIKLFKIKELLIMI
jgi:hypothetical protein